MASLASINIKFSADLQQFRSQMQNVNKQLSSVGKNLQNVGAKLSTALTLPLLGLGTIAIKTAADLETLKTSLDTVFDGNKELSTQAFEDIKDFAATTPFQLEEVAQAFIKLKNLGLDPSIDSLTSYGNTASALGKSLDQMIEAVADASVGEFERLKEFGIKARSEGDNVAFTFQGVTTTVKKNSEDIQQYLLAIGNTQFAGSIERQAQTFNGKLSTLRDNISQAFAGIGEIIIDYITPLFDKINGVLKKFQELSPTTKKWIVILGGIAAAIGPLLALAGTILPAIGTGLTLLTGPIGLIVAGLTAIGVVIYKNWKPIKQTLIDIANYFIDLYNESTVFRVAVEAVVATFKTLWEIGKFVFEGLKSIIGGFIDNFVTGFKTIGKIIKAVFTGNLGEIPAIIKAASKESLGNFKDLTTNLGNDWKNLVDGIKTVTNEGIANVTSRKKIKFLGENVDASEITEQVADATAKGLDQGLTKTPSGGSGFSTPQVSSVNAGLSAEGVTQIESPLSQMVQVLPTQIALVDEQLLTFKAKLVDFNDAATSIMQSAAENFAVGFGNVIAAIATGANPINSIASLLISTIGDLLQQLGKAAIQIGITMKAVKASFANPVAAIAAGIAAIAIGGIIKSFIPKDLQGFADGGIVGGNSFYGDKILARVNSGELILNQRQQRALYSAIQTPQAQDYSFTSRQIIEGDKLILVTERAQKKKDRRS